MCPMSVGIQSSLRYHLDWNIYSGIACAVHTTPHIHTWHEMVYFYSYWFALLFCILSGFLFCFDFIINSIIIIIIIFGGILSCICYISYFVCFSNFSLFPNLILLFIFLQSRNKWWRSGEKRKDFTQSKQNFTETLNLCNNNR